MKESADFLKTSQELDVVLESLSEKAVLCRLSQSVWSGNKNGSISLMLIKGLIYLFIFHLTDSFWKCHRQCSLKRHFKSRCADPRSGDMVDISSYGPNNNAELWWSLIIR